MCRTLALCSLLVALPALAGCGKDDGLTPEQRKDHYLRKVLPGIDENVELDPVTGLSRKTVLTSSYELDPWIIAYHAEPFRTKPFDDQTDVWVTRWRSNTEDADGQRAPDDIHCHAFFSNVPVLQRDDQVFSGIYTDGFTHEFILPDGYGLRFTAGKRLVFQPMFNNRRPTGRQARMRLEIDYYPIAKKELVELKSFTLSSARPDLYMIPPREPGTEHYHHEMVRHAEAPVTGRIHAMGAHLHPYGKYVELRRERNDEVLFTARMIEAEELENQVLTTYSSKEGVYIRQGERLIITTVYENPLDEEIDAMGGFFILYDPEGEPDA